MLKPALAVIFFFVVIAGVSMWQGHSQISQNPSPSPDASAEVTIEDQLKTPVPTSNSTKPSPTAISTSQPSPTQLPSAGSASTNATVYVDTACAADHDGLGKHLDATLSFRNLEKLDSKDLVVSVIDTVTQRRSESHVPTALINNLSIPGHKYAYAYQGSTVPLELLPDGRDYIVRIMKATYKADGTIDVYVFAQETKFSKKCEF